MTGIEDLTGFQRDLLFVIAGLDDPHGLSNKEEIADLTGVEGTIEWDTSKPEEQQRRQFDTSRAEEYFVWEATTSLEEELEETIDWYKTNRDRIS